MVILEVISSTLEQQTRMRDNLSKMEAYLFFDAKQISLYTTQTAFSIVNPAEHEVVHLYLVYYFPFRICSEIEIFLRLKLMKRVFRALRAYAIVARERQAAAEAVAMAVEIEVAEARQLQCAAERYRRRLLTLVLKAWICRTRTLRVALYRQRTSSAYYRRVSLHRVFLAWINFCAKRTSVYAAITHFEV